MQVIDEPVVPKRRLSSRMLQIEEDEFDIDLNPLEMEECDHPDERFLNDFNYKRGFDNIKCFEIGPRYQQAFDRADPGVQQLNLMINPYGYLKHQTHEVIVKNRLQRNTLKNLDITIRRRK